MRRSIRKFNIPRETPRAFEPLKIGLFKFPPLGARKLFKCPTNYYCTTSPQDKFRLQSNTLLAFQREICRNDTLKLLLKTLLKGSFTNKGEILSCKSVKPSKIEKNSGAYYVRIRDKSRSNSPPFQRKVQISPSPGTTHSQMPRVCPGGDVEVSNWSAHNRMTLFHLNIYKSMLFQELLIVFRCRPFFSSCVHQHVKRSKKRQQRATFVFV